MKSPIAFFCFNRPYHTYRSIINLGKNSEAKDTELIAFLDGPREVKDLIKIESVEKILISYSHLFKSLKIVKSSKNLSSALNIRKGVTEILSKYKSVIVLEDDILVSKYFLHYMNSALVKYENSKRVWHINGYNYPLKTNNHDYYFIRLMHCWGWATWQDRWTEFISNPLMNDPYYINSIFNKEMRNDLDLNSKGNFWSQIEANRSQIINTWAIFWYCFIFYQKGLCLSPSLSHTKNIGLDNSGQNCSGTSNINNHTLNNKSSINFPNEIIENKQAIKEIKEFIDNRYSYSKRFYAKLKMILYKIITFFKVKIKKL